MSFCLDGQAPVPRRRELGKIDLGLYWRTETERCCERIVGEIAMFRQSFNLAVALGKQELCLLGIGKV
jgi:hypothetical protein